MDEQRLRVLLIEDDRDDYLMVRNLLQRISPARFHLDWAATYEDALKAMEEGHYEICLLDYRLGEHNGLELLQRIKEKKECGFPIILLTGHRDYEVDIEAMRAGAADYLVKEAIRLVLDDSSIACTYSFPDKLWPVEVDHGQMRQAIGNIVVNAGEAMPGGA